MHTDTGYICRLASWNGEETSERLKWRITKKDTDELVVTTTRCRQLISVILLQNGAQYHVHDRTCSTMCKNESASLDGDGHTDSNI